MIEALESWDQRIPTGQLNTWLRAVIAQTPPPMRGGRLPRVLFATQAASKPPVIVLFTTGFLEHGYRRFLERRLRESFGFEGSPVRIAGVNVGKVTGIKRQPGTTAAIVTMEIQDKGLPIHKDATLKIRPRIFLEGNFFVDVQPGTPDSPTISDNDTIGLTQTATPVQLDQVLTALQANSREDLQAALEGFGTALTAKPTAEEDADQDEDTRGETAAESLNGPTYDVLPAGVKLHGPTTRGAATPRGAQMTVLRKVKGEPGLSSGANQGFLAFSAAVLRMVAERDRPAAVASQLVAVTASSSPWVSTSGTTHASHTQAFQEAMVAGLRDSGVPVVGVEITSTDPSQIGWFEARDIASVDDLDDRLGHVRLELAVARSVVPGLDLLSRIARGHGHDVDQVRDPGLVLAAPDVRP